MICPFCGATPKEEHPKFCPSCGKSLEHLSAQAPSAQAAAGVLGPGQEEVFFEGRPAAIGSVGALLLTILTLGLAAIYFWFRSLGRKYRITSQRVVIEYGVLSKRVEQIDLYRIVDFIVTRSFGQRIMGTGTITLDSTDKSTPDIRIEGVRTNVMGLYERMRAASLVEKQRRGVRTVDLEQP
ncbi:MAG TPA: PH domain-containing protein [Polyangiaceae bacterium]|nr:PH domain-containing protein [Polyangiaceae bacterium]